MPPLNSPESNAGSDDQTGSDGLRPPDRCLPSAAHVIAIVAHPDDESFACGGALAHYARHGAKIDIVTATAGEAGSVHPQSTMHAQSARDLAALRMDELCAAAAVVDASVSCLGLPDGNLQACDATLDAALKDHAVEGALVITFDTCGAYGHRDHVAVHHAVCRTLDAHERLFAHFAAGTFTVLKRALRRSGMIDPDAAPTRYASDDLVLSLDPALKTAKLQMLAAHRSQLVADRPETFLTAQITRQLLVEERFAHAPARNHQSPVAIN